MTAPPLAAALRASRAETRNLRGTDPREQCGPVQAYRGRSPLVENVNGHLKAKYGLTHFLVRGVEKATCVLLLTALAHNLSAHGQRLVDALA